MIEPNKLSPFQKFCVTIGMIPTSYKNSLTYEEQLMWFCDFLENKVIPAVNNNAEALEEVQTLFNQLQNYVDNYFENLDVQEEINNKLDAMVEDGTLANIINQEIFQDILDEINENKKYQTLFHVINPKTQTGNCFIIQFANGKNMFIDTGAQNEWTNILYQINQLGITKFDYGVITHPHYDHMGNLENFIQTFDVSDCVFYTGATPNLTKIPESDVLKYQELANIFSTYDITPVVPTNNSEVVVDTLSKAKIRFLNTDTTWFTDYYEETAEYYTEGINANVFSLVTEITIENVKILECGDIEKCVEDKLVPYMSKIDLMTAPHHFSNKHFNNDFWNIVHPEFVVNSTMQNVAVYGNLEYINALNNKYTIVYTKDIENALITFTTYGYNFSNNAGGYTDVILPKLYNNIASLFGSEHFVDPAEAELVTILNSMNNGDIINFKLYDTFTQLISDLQTICPAISANDNICIKLVQDVYIIEVVSRNSNLFFELKSLNKTNWTLYGKGVIGNVHNIDNLIAALEDLPEGNYQMNYYDQTNDDVLQPNGAYTLNININMNNGTRVLASIIATLRSTSDNNTVARCVSGYIDSTNATTHRWFKLN